jgi:hypothetical protein
LPTNEALNSSQPNVLGLADSVGVGTLNTNLLKWLRVNLVFVFEADDRRQCRVRHMTLVDHPSPLPYAKFARGSAIYGSSSLLKSPSAACSQSVSTSTSLLINIDEQQIAKKRVVRYGPSEPILSFHVDVTVVKIIK